MFVILAVRTIHRLADNATGAIARFCGSLAALFLLATWRLPRLVVSNEALPGNRKNAHSHPFNYRF